MRFQVGLIIAATLATGALAGAAWAQPGHISDVAYMEAARCAGLASSAKLGSVDGGSMKAFVRTQSVGREPFIQDKADDMQRQARREADHADDYSKAKLTQELHDTCTALQS